MAEQRIKRSDASVQPDTPGPESKGSRRQGSTPAVPTAPLSRTTPPLRRSMTSRTPRSPRRLAARLLSAAARRPTGTLTARGTPAGSCGGGSGAARVRERFHEVQNVSGYNGGANGCILVRASSIAALKCTLRAFVVPTTSDAASKNRSISTDLPVRGQTIRRCQSTPVFLRFCAGKTLIAVDAAAHLCPRCPTGTSHAAGPARREPGRSPLQQARRACNVEE